MQKPTITLVPLRFEEREQFILDNQEAFNYGALEEFGTRSEHYEEPEQIISRSTIIHCLDHGSAYRIFSNNTYVGGLSVNISGKKGELEILFIKPEAHSQGIGQAAWHEVEKLYPEVEIWETETPYFEKRNLHFYLNRLGFRAVNFHNEYQPEPPHLHLEEQNSENHHLHAQKNDEHEEMFLFRRGSIEPAPHKSSPKQSPVRITPLHEADWEQFISDNLDAIYAADLARAADNPALLQTITREETDPDAEEALSTGEAYRIMYDDTIVGGVIITPKGNCAELTLLFINAEQHNKGIGQAAWSAIEKQYPQVHVWNTATPYHDKRNIHFYVNRLGFHITEFHHEHSAAAKAAKRSSPSQKQSETSGKEKPVENAEWFHLEKVIRL